MSMNSVASLETAPIGRLLLKYALPAIAGMIVFSLYNVVDSIFIGQWVGEYALAALAIAFPVMNLVAALGTLLGVGGAALCSIRLGEKRPDEAARVLGNVFSLSIAFGVVLGGLGAFFIEPILRAFGASEHTLGYACDFMRVILLSAPVTYLLFNQNHIMRATGYPNRALATLAITVCVNVILAPLFIRVFGWGITGAALATLCAQACGAAFIFHHFLSSKSSVHFRRGTFFPRKKTVLPVISIGSAPSILNICGCAVAVMVNHQLLAQGGDLAVGAYGIFSRVVILVAMVVLGLTQGAQPIIGYNHGAGRPDRVRRTFWLTFAIGVAITTAGCLVCEFFPEAIARCFTRNDELIANTVRGLRIGTAAFALVGGQIVVNNFFQAIGRGKTAAALSTTRQLLFLIPGLVVFPRFMGQAGVWLSFPIADALAILVTGFVFVHFLRNYSLPNVVMRGVPASDGAEK